MKTANTFYAIIVAGGSGSRMNTTVPKQFIELNGLPVLMHTINAFHQNEYQPKILLVLAKADEVIWTNLVQKNQFKVPHQIVYGGEQRYHSVKNGLNALPNIENAIVAIHDAVRPLVSQKTISNCYKSAMEKGNAIAAVASKDSVRRNVYGRSEALNRDEIFLIQTPQIFKYEQLKEAYEHEFNNVFTDDAAVVEKAGFPINLEAGDQFNFKITFKEDIILAEALLNDNVF